GDAALHVGTLLATIGARVKFGGLSFTTGGAVIRNQLFLRLAGSDTVTDLRGVSLLAGRQHADTTLAIDHAAAGGQSRELFKAVVDGEARAVFQGKITVRREAQKTDAKMMARALLLSDRAEADSKPELEIFADDVQCGHGATTGSLDDQLKFYLMARGIPDKEAEALLIQAFAAEVVEAIAHEDVREALLAATLAWLGERG
ncbi:MAG: SufB/SufD family protein, partial [Xanthobacteraceae bacterium]